MSHGKNLIQELIEDAGYEARSYSGRRMGERTCLATDPGPSVGAFMADLLRAAHEQAAGIEDASDVFEPLDQALRMMPIEPCGRGDVVSFPQIPYTDVEAD